MINRYVSIHKVLEPVLDIGRLPLLILSLCNVRGNIVLVIQLSDIMLEQGELDRATAFFPAQLLSSFQIYLS